MKTYVISLDDSRESWEALYRNLGEEPTARPAAAPTPASGPVPEWPVEWPVDGMALEALAWIHGIR